MKEDLYIYFIIIIIFKLKQSLQILLKSITSSSLENEYSELGVFLPFKNLENSCGKTL